MEVEVAYKLLGQVNANGIPTINDRKFASTVRLREGEWAVLTGLMSRSEAASLGGIAGVAGIPGLGALLSNHTRDTDRTDTVLVIKPRLLNLPPAEYPTPTLLTGTETRPISLL
jgi:general secretion pathway protein D